MTTSPQQQQDIIQVNDHIFIRGGEVQNLVKVKPGWRQMQLCIQLQHIINIFVSAITKNWNEEL